MAKAKVARGAKGEAVKAALAAGVTKNKEIIDYVKKNNNLDITDQTVYQVKKKAKDGGSVTRPAAPMRAMPAGGTAVGNGFAGGLSVEDLGSLVALKIKAGGSDRLKAFLDVLK